MQKRKLFNITFDTEEYLAKIHKSEYPSQTMRVNQAEAERLSIESIAYKIGRGSAYVSGRIEGKRQRDSIYDIDFISLDIDNDNGTEWTPGEVIEEVYKLIGARPFLYYQTFTGNREDTGAEKFRLLYSLEDTLSHIEVTPLLEYLADNLSNILDTACKDASRIYQGTNASNRKTETYIDYTEIPTDLINQIISDNKTKELEAKAQREADRIARAEKRAKDLKENGITYNDNVIEELTQIDLSDYLLDMGYSDIKKTQTGYKMPCPIHNGTNDNFNINYVDGQWLYICFSKCGGRGGNLITLHKELTGLSIGEAIKELCDKYSIERYSSLHTLKNNSDTYTIDKYISSDREAVNGIIDAIKDNQTILITGAMGIGKTHFICNDLLTHSKASGKPIVVVMPGVKQLEYVHENKNIPVVYEKLPEYMGTDIVATTPESLPKITTQLGIEGYILVVDESHERYLSLYRRGYKNQNIDQAMSTAYRTIHLSATPRILQYDNFDKVINIDTRCKIENKVSIVRMKGDKDDTIVSLLKRSTRKGKQVILFNNHKGNNELYLSETLRDTTLEGETVSSETNSSDIAKGIVSKDLTITTSVITAGIDLETRENALLYIDLESINIDNMIQLIGRFRKGIEVVILVKDRTEKEYIDLEKIIYTNLKASGEIIDFMNSKPNITELLSDGFKGDSGIIYDNNTWKTDRIQIVSNSYESWNDILKTKAEMLIEILKNQNAFNLKSEVKIYDYTDQEEKSVSEKKKLDRQEAKLEKDRIIPKMLTLRVDDLTEALMEKDISKCYSQKVKELADDISKYKEIASSEFETIKELSKILFYDGYDPTYYHSGLGFKFYHTNTKKRVNQTLESLKASEINQLIKEHGLEFYLSDELKKFRSSKDILQARIRKELQDLEANQGRISDARLSELTKVLIREGYLYGKSVKLYKAEDTETEDREKALNTIKENVWNKIKCIYNLKRKNVISSVKSNPESILNEIRDEVFSQERPWKQNLG